MHRHATIAIPENERLFLCHYFSLWDSEDVLVPLFCHKFSALRENISAITKTNLAKMKK